MSLKTYLIVYETLDNEVNLAKIELTDEQAFEVGCLSAVSHVMSLPLSEDDLEEISVNDALALESEYEEDDTRWDKDVAEDDEGEGYSDLDNLDEGDL